MCFVRENSRDAGSRVGNAVAESGNGVSGGALKIEKCARNINVRLCDLVREILQAVVMMSSELN